MLGKRKNHPEYRFNLDYKKLFQKYRYHLAVILTVIMIVFLFHGLFSKPSATTETIKVTKFVREDGHELEAVNIGNTQGFVHSPECPVCNQRYKELCCKALVAAIDSITIADEKAASRQ